MRTLAYRAGALAIRQVLGLHKLATPAPPAVLKGLDAVKNLVPKTTLGRGAAIGALIGTGIGVHQLTQPNRN